LALQGFAEMTVKKQTRPRGRPQGDPDDLRTERIALRVHSDLLFETNIIARLEGVTRSVLIERLLIRLVNDHHSRTVVDKVGRYVGEPPVSSSDARIREHREPLRKKTPPRRQTVSRWTSK
jgi:hypothetical protein